MRIVKQWLDYLGDWQFWLLGELLTRPAVASSRDMACAGRVLEWRRRQITIACFLAAFACYYSPVKIQFICLLLQQDSEWPPVSCLHLLVIIAQSRYNLFACHSRTTWLRLLLVRRKNGGIIEDWNLIGKILYWVPTSPMKFQWNGLFHRKI